jgi:choline-sulfatase
VIWALTADHGEALGEHGTVGHNSTLYEEQIRVPFLIGGAGVSPGRVSEPVSTQDLPATLLRLAGARIPAGVTLLPPWSMASETRHGSAPVLSYMTDACSLIQGDWKLIADTHTQSLALFDLASDPGELRGRLLDEPERARSMLAAMREAGCRADLRLLAASLER